MLAWRIVRLGGALCGGIVVWESDAGWCVIVVSLLTDAGNDFFMF